MCPLPLAVWQPQAPSMLTKMSSHLILPASACKLPISSLLKALVCSYGAVRPWLGLGTDSEKSGHRVIQGLYSVCIHKMYIHTPYTRYNTHAGCGDAGGHDRWWRKQPLMIRLCWMGPGLYIGIG